MSDSGNDGVSGSDWERERKRREIGDAERRRDKEGGGEGW
jgi:hypothetical protein